MSTDVISDWAARCRSRLYEQFKELPNFQAISDAIAVQLQALEDSGQQLLGLYSVDDSQGAQLVRLARLVGQNPIGYADGSLRYYVRARIRSNKSSGPHADLYAVFFAMFGAAAKLRIEPGFPAGLTLYITLPLLDDATAAIALLFLDAAKAAPVYAVLVWQGAVDDEMFYTGNTDYVGVALAGGETQITLQGLGSLPSFGQLLLDEGTAAQEQIHYSSTLTPNLYNCTPINNAHDVNTAASLVGSPGLGFDNIGGGVDLDVGGKLAGAAAT